MKLLFAASEVYPLIKTGGLADVVYGLPQALHELDNDIRLVIPGYRSVLDKLGSTRVLGRLSAWGDSRVHEVQILEAEHEAFPFPVWVVDCAALFDRPGNPYLHDGGYDWHDNAERYCVFSRVVAQLADDALHIDWRPDVVHVHDWQTGLVPAFLEDVSPRPKCVFTIHNLAYSGHFSHELFQRLHLKWHWWSEEGMEFHGGFSMLKAGIVYCDVLNTVSPTYANEICTPEFGYGMEGLLRSRGYKLHGILNGVDGASWNPETDPYLPHHYNAKKIQPGKQKNKQALLERFGFDVTEQKAQQPLLGFVGRLVEQKGIDMILDSIPELVHYSDACFVLLGSGDYGYEQQINELHRRFPQRVRVYIGYDEGLAHLVEAGCDMFMMPSRFEPCGLNQMYSLKYGTLPVVYNTGGLADTVVNATDENIKQKQANGFMLYNPTREAFKDTVFWALGHFTNKKHWQQLQRNAMQPDFGWERSAQAYIDLYEA
uniref:Glycogen synthase n=1 Tax=uncultured Thiotrichaceae bacterium TaxID=298394 RepID=A0A6S6UIV5_9GAMM|nr:MAG: Glycogen synthase, ADP-glucose transglucosylase (EC [uncultured Thiotrichaceae bacterium]